MVILLLIRKFNQLLQLLLLITLFNYLILEISFVDHESHVLPRLHQMLVVLLRGFDKKKNQSIIFKKELKKKKDRRTGQLPEWWNEAETPSLLMAQDNSGEKADWMNGDKREKTVMREIIKRKKEEKNKQTSKKQVNLTDRWIDRQPERQIKCFNSTKGKKAKGKKAQSLPLGQFTIPMCDFCWMM